MTTSATRRRSASAWDCSATTWRSASRPRYRRHRRLACVDYGVAMFATDYSVDPGTFARSAEERGFESVFFPEHTHIPVSRQTPYPSGGELPPQYSHTHDLFVALTAAAAATQRIKIRS